MAAAADDDSNRKLLRELDVLGHTLYQAHGARRTPSLFLPRSSDDIPALSPTDSLPSNPVTRPRPRRLSMSPFRSRPQPEPAASEPLAAQAFSEIPASAEPDKKGIWGWKPLRALSHIGMHRLAVLFSVEVAAAQSLPATMNGLRLSIVVRKREAKEGAVQTMPARVVQGTADFEETLFIRCHVFYTGGGTTGKPLRLEPRTFLIFPVAVDAPDLDFGRSSVELSSLVKDSMERSFEGYKVRQWDSAFRLSGKAKGGKLVFKLGFQIMEDGGGAGVFRQASDIAARSFADSSSSFARRQSKSSFSVSSPRGTRSGTPVTPSKDGDSALELKGIEEFDLDEELVPAPRPPFPKSRTETESTAADDDDSELPDFEVIDKGFESGSGKKKEADAASNQANEVSASTSIPAASAEVVVHSNAHNVRLTELDSIAKQIKALELMMMNDGGEDEEKSDPCGLLPEGAVRQLNAEEETTTRKFLQMLELEDDNGFQQPSKAAKSGSEAEATGYLPDLGKGLGPIVRTKDGGFLASMNPFDAEVRKRESPKLAMQISRPIIIDDGGKPSAGGGGGGGVFFEVFQKLAGKGLEELESKLLSLTSMDELAGKTAEQIAFEGIASAIVSGRNRELAKSAAARSIAALKSIAREMNEGRKERIAAGIWNMREEPLASVGEALSFSLQKMEAMAVEALKLQAGAAEKEPPFDVSPLGCGGGSWLLDHAVPLEDWLKKGVGEGQSVILMAMIQLRDPLRWYEAVGTPMIAMVQVAGVAGDEERRYKVCGLHIGGIRLSSGRKAGSAWDGERQRLKAMQWAAGYGMAKAGKCGKAGGGRGDAIWSLSSRVMADMWLKTARNPDVKLLDR